MRPPKPVSVMCFEQKLPGDVLAFCADGFADADLAGAFVTLTSMMFITPTPPMSRADGAEDNRGDRDFPDDVVKFLDLFFGVATEKLSLPS